MLCILADFKLSTQHKVTKPQNCEEMRSGSRELVLAYSSTPLVYVHFTKRKSKISVGEMICLNSQNK